MRVTTVTDKSGAAELLAAISHFKAKHGLISKSAPHAFLDADEQALAEMCHGVDSRKAILREIV